MTHSAVPPEAAQCNCCGAPDSEAAPLMRCNRCGQWACPKHIAAIYGRERAAFWCAMHARPRARTPLGERLDLPKQDDTHDE